jgi:hypothetical protein
MGLAGPASFARGVAYYREDRVELGAVGSDGVQAVVRGSLPYHVELRADGGGAVWSCSCPVGADGAFCKHCVAVALAVGSGEEVARPPSRRAPPADGGEATLRSYLGTLSSDRLVDIVLDQAGSDWRLRERLAARAAAVAGSGIDEPSWRKRITSAFRARGGFIPYREAADWAAGVGELIDGLEDLLEAGHAEAAAGLAERAHRRADKAIDSIDDSAGWLSGISERLGRLHQRACEVCRPDPVGLARRLVDLELTSELDGFHRAAARYAGVLGPAGIAEYRRLLEPRWRSLAPTSEPWSSERFRVQEAMIGVALATGDPDELIAVKQGDLGAPDDYQEIAESLRDAGRIDDAVDWARRGLRAFGDRPWQVPPLRELLAAVLRGRGDAGGAVGLFWDAFVAHPSLGAYRRLLSEATAVASPVDWKVRALVALRARVAEHREADRFGHSLPATAPATALVEILLYEGDVAAAWEAAAEHGCDQRLWLTLARAREATHPLDAVAVYEREALAQIETKKNDGYRRAVDHLSRIRHLAAAGGEPDRFDHLVARVRSEHRPKRNLMALLDQQGW